MSKKMGERHCVCGCGELAKRIYSQGGRFKSWCRYAPGHSPNEPIEVRVPTDPAILAYAAGIIDGEGCIYARVFLRETGYQTSLQLKVDMCTSGVITWLGDNFGGEVFVLQPRNNAKMQYAWQLRGRLTKVVLEAILPYLQVKRKRAELAIQLAGLLQQNRMQKLTEDEVKVRSAIADQIRSYNVASGEDIRVQ